MLRGLFVTGTGTDVGKTVISAALLHRYRGELPLRYWKPIQTGIEQDDDTTTVRRLGACRDEELWCDGVRLKRPVSPHMAAVLEGTTIEISDVLSRIANAHPNTRWIVEGAGGVLVPINNSQLMIDLIQQLQLPTVVVARAELGTINHTLLTLEALRSRGIEIAGVVMSGVPHEGNREAIERYGNVKVLGELPHRRELSPETLKAWAVSQLDPNGRLGSFLQ